jgi:hypothetical protein
MLNNVQLCQIIQKNDKRKIIETYYIKKQFYIHMGCIT